MEAKEVELMTLSNKLIGSVEVGSDDSFKEAGTTKGLLCISFSLVD